MITYDPDIHTLDTGAPPITRPLLHMQWLNAHVPPQSTPPPPYITAHKNVLSLPPIPHPLFATTTSVGARRPSSSAPSPVGPPAPALCAGWRSYERPVYIDFLPQEVRVVELVDRCLCFLERLVLYQRVTLLRGRVQNVWY